jgi:hypothetical protein
MQCRIWRWLGQNKYLSDRMTCGKEDYNDCRRMAGDNLDIGVMYLQRTCIGTCSLECHIPSEGYYYIQNATSPPSFHSFRSNDVHDVPPPTHPSTPARTTSLAAKDGATVSSTHPLPFDIPSDPIQIYMTSRIPPLPLAFSRYITPLGERRTIPASPRAITPAKGMSSGGICLIFCHVGRNLGLVPPKRNTRHRIRRDGHCVRVDWVKLLKLHHDGESVEPVLDAC